MSMIICQGLRAMLQDTTTALECPKCQRQGFVRLYDHAGEESDAWECIYCHHQDDLSRRSHRGNPIDAGFALLIAILIALLLIGV